MLPKIIVGSSTGSLVAAILAVSTDEELEELFRNPNEHIDYTAFEKRGKGGFRRKIVRFLKHGKGNLIQDILWMSIFWKNLHLTILAT